MNYNFSGLKCKYCYKDKRVTIRLNEEEFAILVEYAQDHDITVTQAVKSCIQEKILNRC